MTASKRDLFLITGIPATGKTWYGDRFEKQFDFTHHDLENGATLTRLLAAPMAFIGEILARNTDAVATWGFNPEHQSSVSAVLQFKNSGFRLIWLDGNRRAALERFDARARIKSSSSAEYYWRMHEFYLQMYRIETSKVIEAIKPVLINPFDAEGKFKPTATILEEMNR